MPRFGQAEQGSGLVITTLQLGTTTLSRLIGLGYETAIRPSSWRTFAEELALAAACRVAIVIYVDHVNVHRSFLISGGIADDFDKRLSTHLFHDGEDPYWTAMQTLSPGSAQLGDEIVSRNAQRRNAYYSSLCKPWSLQHFLLGCITTGDEFSAFLTLGRSECDPPFRPADKAFFSEQLLTHLHRSLNLGREIAAVRDGRAQMMAVVDTAPSGIVVFDGNGCVTMVNRRATELLADHDALAVVDGRLHAADPATHAELQAALAAALSATNAPTDATPPADPVAVARSAGNRPYRVVFAPLQLPAGADEPAIGSFAVATIYRRWRASYRSFPTTFRETYGLTRAETRLCQALLSGRSLPEASAYLAISRNTAKTHLGRIFDKTGVHSQAALLRLLALSTRGSQITNA